jgi:N-acetylmuramic acid 6-phosphate (MurNAc-6-P) etherase
MSATFGVPFDLVIRIAGGDTAIRKAVENAETTPHKPGLTTFDIK